MTDLRPALEEPLPTDRSEERPLSVLFVMPVFMPESYGGAEQQCRRVAERMMSRGVTCHVLAPALDASIGDAPVGDLPVTRMVVDAYPNNGGRDILSFLSWTMRVRQWIKARRHDFDIIYVFHSRLHALGPALGALEAGIPMFTKLGGGGPGFEFYALRAKKYLYGRWAETKIRAATTKFVSNASQITRDLQDNGVMSAQILEVANGFDAPPETEVFSAIARRDARHMVFAGRFAAVKNLPLIIEACGILKARDVPFRLTLLGDGPEFSALSARVSALGLEDVVSLPGAVTDPASYFFDADFYVSASEVEGQSNALIEAMAHGVVPIVVRASGTEDLILESKSGIVVEQATAEGLAAALAQGLELSREDRHRLALGAYHHITELADLDRVVDRTLDAFHTALTATGEPANPGVHASI